MAYGSHHKEKKTFGAHIGRCSKAFSFDNPDISKDGILFYIEFISSQEYVNDFFFNYSFNIFARYSDCNP